MTSRNEAAERLALILEGQEAEARDNGVLLREALAAERRATVERIRERLVTNGAALEWGDIEAILDEVAK